MSAYQDPKLQESYTRGRDAALDYALSRIKEDIIADDIPDDIDVPDSRAWHNGWNSTIRQARQVAVNAVAELATSS